jgi:hypothetical protein
MKLTSFDIICKCGHHEKYHYMKPVSFGFASLDFPICKKCKKYDDMFHDYKSDNLLYIEQLAKQKNLI